MSYLLQFRTWCDSLNTAVWPTMMSLIVFGLVYFWRQKHAKSFEWLKTVWPPFQNVPALALGVLLQAGPNLAGDAKKLLGDVLLGVMSGILAIMGHHAAKVSPLAYTGLTGDEKKAQAAPVD